MHLENILLYACSLNGVEFFLVSGEQQIDEHHTVILRNGGKDSWSVAATTISKLSPDRIGIISGWRPLGFAPWKRLQVWSKCKVTDFESDLASSICDWMLSEGLDEFATLEDVLVSGLERPLVITAYIEMGHNGVYRTAVHESYLEQATGNSG